MRPAQTAVLAFLLVAMSAIPAAATTPLRGTISAASPRTERTGASNPRSRPRRPTSTRASSGCARPPPARSSRSTGSAHWGRASRSGRTGPWPPTRPARGSTRSSAGRRSSTAPDAGVSHSRSGASSERPRRSSSRRPRSGERHGAESRERHGAKAVNVTVRLFAALREQAGTSRLELDLPEGEQVLRRLGRPRPRGRGAALRSRSR